MEGDNIFRYRNMDIKLEGREMAKEVYSIGFSFADVDLIYIKEICRKLSVDAVWYLNDFLGNRNRKWILTRIDKCAFF